MLKLITFKTHWYKIRGGSVLHGRTGAAGAHSRRWSTRRYTRRPGVSFTKSNRNFFLENRIEFWKAWIVRSLVQTLYTYIYIYAYIHIYLHTHIYTTYINQQAHMYQCIYLDNIQTHMHTNTKKTHTYHQIDIQFAVTLFQHFYRLKLIWKWTHTINL